MNPRLIDLILSPQGLMIGLSYVLASAVVLVIVVLVLDRWERRRMDRAIARVVRDARRENPEDAARWTP